jgi:hypothetical protein
VRWKDGDERKREVENRRKKNTKKDKNLCDKKNKKCF